MRRVIFALSLSLSIFAATGLSALASPSADLPLVPCGKLVCIDANDATGAPLRLLIDTGNAHTLLNRSVADRLKLATKPAHGADGKEVSGYGLTEPTELDLGAVKLTPVPLLVADISGYVKAVGAPFDGVLSYTQLKGWIAELDLKDHRFHLTQDAVAKPRSSLRADYVKYRADAVVVLVVDGLAVHGYPLRAQLDTAFEGGLLMFPAAFATTGLADQRTGEQVSLGSYDDGAPMDRMPPTSIAFDRTKLIVPSDGAFAAGKDVRLPENDIEVVAGLELFSGHRLVLDFIHNQVGVD